MDLYCQLQIVWMSSPNFLAPKRARYYSHTRVFSHIVRKTFSEPNWFNTMKSGSHHKNFKSKKQGERVQNVAYFAFLATPFHLRRFLESHDLTKETAVILTDYEHYMLFLECVNGKLYLSSPWSTYSILML